MSEPEPRIWDYRVVELVRAVDGDTFDLTLEKQIDFGFRLIEDKRWTSRFRLLGVDAPELRNPGGPEAREFAAWWISIAEYRHVLRGQTFKTDSFGRWLIDLYRSDIGEHLADAMVAAGHAVAWTRHQ